MRSSARLAVRLAMLLVWLAATEALRAEEPVDFQTQIAPLFVDHCLQCHSAGIDKGDVSLATVEDLISGGHVVPGEPENSYLLDLITVADDQTADMPKEGPPLSVTQVDLVRRWIAEGAKWPEGLLRARSPARTKPGGHFNRWPRFNHLRLRICPRRGHTIPWIASSMRNWRSEICRPAGPLADAS